MWPAFTVLAYFGLALVLPVSWALGRVWLRTRHPRQVTCPRLSAPAWVQLDCRYAVRMHARGDNELRIIECSNWPNQSGCRQECLSA